ncbi:MAG: hypothetical protein AAF767_02690 [Pseudomonadota bacterium]
MIDLTKSGAVALVALGMSFGASAQGFPSLPKISFPKPSDTSQSSTTTEQVVGAGAGCAVGGTAGYFGAKALDSVLRSQGYTGAEIEQVALLAAGVGCVVGGSAALSIIQNMDEKSKQKQEEAWEQAKANGGNEPIAWEGPRDSGYSGNVSIEPAEPLVDGTECITRKDYVLDASGQDATVYNRYCKNENDEFELLEGTS